MLSLGSGWVKETNAEGGAQCGLVHVKARTVWAKNLPLQKFCRGNDSRVSLSDVSCRFQSASCQYTPYNIIPLGLSFIIGDIQHTQTSFTSTYLR